MLLELKRAITAVIANAGFNKKELNQFP